MKKITLTIGFVVLITTLPSFAQDNVAPVRAETEINTRLGKVRIGSTKDDLYKIYQNLDRIFSHRAMDTEWIVFRDWTSANPKTDVITFCLKNNKVTEWQRAFVPSPENEGSIYEYKKGDKIQNWFFPSGKSRWDGENMSILEWNLLTDTQKVMFLTEYISKLSEMRSEKIAIDTPRYVLAVNYYADTGASSHIADKITNEIDILVARDAEIEQAVESASANSPAPEAQVSEPTTRP